MTRTIQILIIFIFIVLSCNIDDEVDIMPRNETPTFLSAVDISSYPEISSVNPIFYDLEGNQKDMLMILKENGVNTIRLRLWVNPNNEHSGFEEVKQFSQIVKALGFKTWITLHYSDSWADPGNQETPAQWQGLRFYDLKDSVYAYTQKVIAEIKPNYIQIGNEINAGLLHPYGNISTNYESFIDIINEACAAVRDNSDSCKIILHFAGIENSEWFFNQLTTVDYDIIGLSYYPIWHGKSLKNLKTTMQNLSVSNNKQIVIAETAYPFTLEWNDLTNNIVGLDEQLILPEYPATPVGQRKFISSNQKYGQRN